MLKCQLMISQECVSTRAKAAIGYQTASMDIEPGDPADFILFGQTCSVRSQGSRQRRTIQEIVYDANPERLTVRSGFMLSRYS